MTFPDPRGLLTASPMPPPPPPPAALTRPLPGLQGATTSWRQTPQCQKRSAVPVFSVHYDI